MGKMFQNASSLKPLGQLKPSCPGIIIWRSFKKLFFNADPKFKMATTTGHRLTLDPMGKCSNMNIMRYGVNVNETTRPSWKSIIGRSFTNFVFFMLIGILFITRWTIQPLVLILSTTDWWSKTWILGLCLLMPLATNITVIYAQSKWILDLIMTWKIRK